MKKILNTLRSLGLQKILPVIVFGVMSILLILGPTMLRASERSIEPTTATTTAPAASTKATGASNSTAAGLNPSTGKLSSPSQVSATLPVVSINPVNIPTDSNTDPCIAINAAIDQIQKYYVVPNQDLQAEITNNKMTIMSITSLIIGQGGVPTPAQQASLNQANNIYQTDTNKLQANMAQMNQQLAPYKQQSLDNTCI